MASLSFQAKFSAYIEVASLTVLVWDILNNLENDYFLLFRRRFGLPTLAYFLSRLSALCWAIITVIYTNNQSIDCLAFQATSTALLVICMTSTMFLCYIRVCAVWFWDRFIVAFFGVSWLFVAGSSATVIRSVKAVQVDTFCQVVIVDGRLIIAPFVVAVVNHTLVFMAITYGVCKNTLRGDLTFKHGFTAMLGKSLPTFSRALLHGSQIAYIFISAMSIIALIWVNAWSDQTDAAFRIAPMAPYLVIMTILNGRVHRNTKLGLYNVVSLQSNDRKSQPHAAVAYNMLPRSSQSAVKPIIPKAVTHIESSAHIDSSAQIDSSDYSTTRSRGSVTSISLDFGMV